MERTLDSTITTSTSIGMSQHCALLSLPAELRNRTYDFCQEDGTIGVRLKAEPWPNNRDSDSDCDGDCNCQSNINCDLALKRQDFFVLTQLCRQLRSEILPIYLERTQIAIDPWDLDEGYIPTFLTPPGTKIEDAVGNLVITIHPREDSYYYDLTPIIRLAQQAERVHITIAYSKDFLSSHDNDFLQLANKFFSPRDAPLLHEYFQRAVEKISLFVEDDRPSISFRLHLRDECYEHAWMDGWAYRNKGMGLHPVSEETQRGMVEWSTQLGLEIGCQYGESGWYIWFC